MNIIGDIFNLILVQPIVNTIIGILYALQKINMPGATGFSIIILTLVVNMVIWPFRSKQIRYSKILSDKMALLKPQIKKLKEKHKDDKMKFNQEQAALFKEHGVNPAAGCLPSLIPILLIFPLYQVIFAFFDGAAGLEKINYFLYYSSWHLSALPDLNFFGLNLGVKPSEFATGGFLLLLVPLVTGVLTFMQSMMMAPKKVNLYKSDSPKEIKEKEESEDMAVAMQKQMTFMMPIMIGFFAFQFPVGLALYWNTVTILSVIQQYLISGWGGLEDLILRLQSVFNKGKIH